MFNHLNLHKDLVEISRDIMGSDKTEADKGDLQEAEKTHETAVEETLKEAEPGSDEAYEKLVKKMLKDYGVSAPDELDDDEKKEFFNKLDSKWNSDEEPGKDGVVESLNLTEATKDQIELWIMNDEGLYNLFRGIVTWADRNRPSRAEVEEELLNIIIDAAEAEDGTTRETNLSQIVSNIADDIMRGEYDSEILESKKVNEELVYLRSGGDIEVRLSQDEAKLLLSDLETYMRNVRVPLYEPTKLLYNQLRDLVR